MDNYIKSLDMQAIGASKIDTKSCIEALNAGKAVLLDVRYEFEQKVWSLPFALNIPLNELPDRLDELPKDKIIICACPQAFRSNIANQYLTLKGYNAKALEDGLIKFMDHLKGGNAKELRL